MSRLLLAVLLFAASFVFAVEVQAQVEDRYVVFFRDKGGKAGDVAHPEDFLSDRALARRGRQGIKVDSLDVPVYTMYINRMAETARIVGKSKWLNAVMVGVAGGDEAVREIEKLDFVVGIQRVGSYEKEELANASADWDLSGDRSDDPCGVSRPVLSVNGIVSLHDDGFTGQGIMIAVTDDGFCNVDSLQGGWQDRIVCAKDFVNNADSLVYDIGSHGVRTFACMGADVEGCVMGAAPGADYVLLRTEYLKGEQPAEQYYWAFAAEYADSIGADIINVSLGYNLFDDEYPSFTYDDLDASSPMSRCADIAATRGMVVVCSAGNEGSNSWKRITVPSDGVNVLAVGALAANSNSEKAHYSSIGPSADGRVKPDVAAPGTVHSINRNGVVVSGSGTSFAAPVMAGGIACLWEALPEVSAAGMIDIVRRSAGNYGNPDNQLGYGVPDLYKAYLDNRGVDGLISTCADTARVEGQSLIIPDSFASDITTRAVLFDINGRVVMDIHPKGVNRVSLHNLPKGFYVVELSSGTSVSRNTLLYE